MNQKEENTMTSFRMELLIDHLEDMIKELDLLIKKVQEKDEYIKHLEKMLDERLRVV